jgi:hypothetical protein
MEQKLLNLSITQTISMTSQILELSIFKYAKFLQSLSVDPVKEVESKLSPQAGPY